jgi:TolB-like protein/tetratricopeptide (TPR) repeat protein
MMEHSKPYIQIDLNEFKLHLHLSNKPQRTFHFDSPSRRFYLSVIALVVNEMKKRGEIKSIPILQHLDLLALVNESIGGGAGSSDKEHLLPRIYRKWKNALPNLEEAPLFKVLGKKREDGDGATGKVYSFTDVEKDDWANLFEYMGSEENVRLKFAVDMIGISLDETSIVFGDSVNGDAWDRFISSLKKDGAGKPEPVEENAVSEQTLAPFSPVKKEKFAWVVENRWVALLLAIGILAGAWGIWKAYLSPGIKVASVNRMQYLLPDKSSIAVLPFVNLSDDPKQEYFSDGITEDIITNLATVSGLAVVSRNSTFVYKGKTIKTEEVARDLGVRHVLEGSVRREDGRVRITVQLIDGSTGHHVWADKYDRELKEIFSVQDEVARKVVSELAVALTTTETERLPRRHTKNFEAYDTYLRARRESYIIRKENHLKAIDLSRRVINLDPNFAGGYSYLSFLLNRGVRQGWSVTPREDLEQAFHLAWKAIAVDDAFPLAYTSLANAYLAQGKHDDAVVAAEKAASLAPGDAMTIKWLGYYLHWAGRGEEAVVALKKSIEMDPIGSLRDQGYLDFLSWACFTAGRYEESISNMKRAIEKFGPIQTRDPWLIASYSMLGRMEEAREAAQQWLKADPTFSLSSWNFGRTYKRPEDIATLYGALRKAGLK